MEHTDFQLQDKRTKNDVSNKKKTLKTNAMFIKII